MTNSRVGQRYRERDSGEIVTVLHDDGPILTMASGDGEFRIEPHTLDQCFDLVDDRPTHWLRAWIKPKRAADLAIGGWETPYLLRWYLIPRNRWLNVYYHEFRRDDDDRALHDHPWCSMSLAMSGTVHEIDDTGQREIRAGSFRFRSAQYAHRIALLDGQPAETLFVTGPVVRTWGFHCPRGWVPWREFTAGAKGELVGRGCGED